MTIEPDGPMKSILTISQVSSDDSAVYYCASSIHSGTIIEEGCVKPHMYIFIRVLVEGGDQCEGFINSLLHTHVQDSYSFYITLLSIQYPLEYLGSYKGKKCFIYSSLWVFMLSLTPLMLLGKCPISSSWW